MQSTFYTIYKTTCLVNRKTYIGKHITQNLDDGYLGSGKLIRRAIDKYGVENFHKEILHVFDNEADMNAKERELVTEAYVLQKTNYNLCVGGQGGWSYVNRELPNGMTGKKQSDTQKLAAHTHMSGMHEDKEWHKRISTKGGKNSTGFTGMTHSQETRRKMSESKKGYGSGKSNSQFGTRWITNGVENRKIKRTDAIPDGWRAGRNMVL